MQQFKTKEVKKKGSLHMPNLAIMGTLIVVCYSTAKVARLIMSNKLKDKLREFLDLFGIEIEEDENERL